MKADDRVESPNGLHAYTPKQGTGLGGVGQLGETFCFTRIYPTQAVSTREGGKITPENSCMSLAG